jgi:Gpi18-like mannosyltransferase
VTSKSPGVNRSSARSKPKLRNAKSGGREHLLRWDWPTVALILGIKALVLTYAVQAVATTMPAHAGWLEIWKRWDATHYLRLAEKGYVAMGEARVSLVFFPLYPWVVRIVAFIVRNYLIAAFVVSGIASVAAGLLLQRLTRCDEPEEVARNTVWFLFIFPTSYFLHCGYTESLFLAHTLGCLLAARLDRWAIAGLLGAAACLTRVNGLMLVPVLAVEVWLDYRDKRRLDLRWLWLGIVPFGFLAYLWLNYHVTGDFFAFSKIMGEHWYKKFTPPWVGIRDVWLRAIGMNVNEGLNEFLAIVLITICTIWSWLRLRPSYATWMTLNWLLINSTTFVLSVPRYTLMLFPVFILFARACTGRSFWFAMLTVWSLLYLALYTSRFVQGLWAF